MRSAHPATAHRAPLECAGDLALTGITEQEGLECSQWWFARVGSRKSST